MLTKTKQQPQFDDYSKELPKMNIMIIATFVLKMLTKTKQQPQFDGFRIYPGTTTSRTLFDSAKQCSQTSA